MLPRVHPMRSPAVPCLPIYPTGRDDQLIVHAPARTEALSGLRKALREFQVLGLPTNLDFCERVAGHPAFERGGVTTAFLEDHGEEVMPSPASAPPPPHAVVLASVAALLQEVRPDDAPPDRARALVEPHHLFIFVLSCVVLRYVRQHILAEINTLKLGEEGSFYVQSIVKPRNGYASSVSLCGIPQPTGSCPSISSETTFN